jgi:hypothetical protein
MDKMLVSKKTEIANTRSSWPATAGATIFAGFLAALHPGFAAAAPWDFGANVDLGVIRTDNVSLRPSGEEVSETVYTIAPEFFLTNDGDRLRADLRYRPEAYFFSNTEDADNVYHVVDATLNTAIVRERLFLTLNGSNFQSIISPVGVFPTSNIPVTANRIDSRVLEARPYWDQRIGSADLLVEGSYTDIDYEGEQYQGTQIKSGRFDLNNVERQQGVTWGLNYDYTRTEYDVSTPWEFQRASASLGYWITDAVRFFTTGGAESDFENIFEPNLDGDFWEAGLQFAPNERMNLEFAAGDRFYGSSFRLTFDYQLRRGSTSLRYSEGPTTGAQTLLGRNPIVGYDNLDSIEDLPGRSDRFVQRRGEWTTNIELNRSALNLRIFDERREDRIAADGTALPEEKLRGIALRWSWDIGVNTTLGIGGDRAERENDARNDNLTRAALDLTYRFSERLSVIAGLTHSRQRGNESSEYDYDENLLRLLLRTSF